MNQQTMVCLVLQDAIDHVHVYLAFRHAFPDSGVAVACTRARFPGAAGIHNRLISDEEYFLNMSVIVSIRYLAMTSLTYLIAACTDSNYSKWHQGALQRYGRG
jgi:hypothetical protein